MVPALHLASGSAARGNLLSNAGLKFSQAPVDFDEDTAKKRALAKGEAPERIARILARGKANAAGSQSGKIVLGSDQVLAVDSGLFSKAKTREAAMEKLRALQGKTHTLISAASAFRDGEELWSATSKARMKMRPLGDNDIDRYLDHAWPSVSDSVGCYHLEGIGVHLFDTIDGDYFTVLGLPLLEILAFLRSEGATTI